MQIKFKYWGYLHSTGTIYVRYFMSKSDITRAEEDTNIRRIIYPFEAPNREEAFKRIEIEIINKSK